MASAPGPPSTERSSRRESLAQAHSRLARSRALKPRAVAAALDSAASAHVASPPPPPPQLLLEFLPWPSR